MFKTNGNRLSLTLTKSAALASFDIYGKEQKKELIQDIAKNVGTSDKSASQTFRLI
jgi:hypothetical protein